MQSELYEIIGTKTAAKWTHEFNKPSEHSEEEAEESEVDEVARELLQMEDEENKKIDKDVFTTETLFAYIAGSLKATNDTVREVFGIKATVIPEFEGEKNVEILSPDDFFTVATLLLHQVLEAPDLS